MSPVRRLLGLPRLLRSIDRELHAGGAVAALDRATPRQSGRAPADPVAWARRWRRAIAVAARLAPGANTSCLRRSVALQRLAAERGVVAAVVIGVRLSERDVEMHAWCEIDGTPIESLPTGERSFRRMGLR